MPLNLTTLKEEESSIAKAADYSRLIYPSKIESGTNFRILPSNTNLNSVYYLPIKQYIFNNSVFITSPSVLGLPDVIAEAQHDAVEARDEKVLALLNSGDFKIQTSYLTAVYMLQAGFGTDGSIQRISVIDNDYKILLFKAMILQGINKIASNPQYQTGSIEGVFDYEKGYNFVFEKSGTGKLTKYGITGWLRPWPVPAELQIAPVDLYAYVKTMLKSEGVMGNVWSTFLSGGNIIDALTEGKGSDSPISQNTASNIVTSAAYAPPVQGAPVQPQYVQPTQAQPSYVQQVPGQPQQAQRAPVPPPYVQQAPAQPQYVQQPPIQGAPVNPLANDLANGNDVPEEPEKNLPF